MTGFHWSESWLNELVVPVDHVRYEVSDLRKRAGNWGCPVSAHNYLWGAETHIHVEVRGRELGVPSGSVSEIPFDAMPIPTVFHSEGAEPRTERLPTVAAPKDLDPVTAEGNVLASYCAVFSLSEFDSPGGPLPAGHPKIGGHGGASSARATSRSGAQDKRMLVFVDEGVEDARWVIGPVLLSDVRIQRLEHCKTGAGIGGVVGGLLEHAETLAFEGMRLDVRDGKLLPGAGESFFHWDGRFVNVIKSGAIVGENVTSNQRDGLWESGNVQPIVDLGFGVAAAYELAHDCHRICLFVAPDRTLETCEVYVATL